MTADAVGASCWLQERLVSHASVGQHCVGITNECITATSRMPAVSQQDLRGAVGCAGTREYDSSEA
jgi:hypothetical protein